MEARRAVRAGRRVAAALIAAVAALLMTASGAQAAKWLAPADLSPLVANGTNGGCGFFTAQPGVGGPNVAVNAAGDAVASWTQVDGNDSTKQDVVVRVRPAGGSFGAPQVVGTTLPCYFFGVFGETPSVGIDDQGGAVIAWTSIDSTTSNQVTEASIRPAGGAFSAAQEISDASQPANADARVAMNGAGTAVAVWTHYNGTNYVVQQSTKPPGGSFALPQTVSPTGQNASGPAVAINGSGAVVVTWLRQDGTANCGGAPGCNIAQAAVRQASSGAFAAVQTLSAGGENASTPVAAIDPGGRATLVWERDNAGDAVIQSRFLTSAGVLDSGVQNLSAPGAGAGSPQVAVDSSNTAVAVWEISSGVIQASARPSGGSFATPAQDISAPGTSSFLPLPEVAIDPSGNAIAVWSQSTNGGNALVIQAARRPANGSFGAVQNISVDTDFALDQAISIDGQGSAVVDWLLLRQSPDNRFSTQFAVFDAGPPTLTGFSVPNTATTGQPASMSVQASDRWSGAAVNWDFGDGNVAGGDVVSHAWGAPGVYSITTTATDGAGNSTSATHTIQVSNAPPPPPPPPTPRITSPINNTWLVNGRSITAVVLTAGNVPAGSTITMKCTGKPRCRFKKKTIHVKKTGKVNLLKALGRRKNRRFKAGETLEIQITHPGYIGKDVRFRFKKGKIPKGSVRCFKLGATKPSAC
jgi:hypothetical protein